MNPICGFRVDAKSADSPLQRDNLTTSVTMEEIARNKHGISQEKLKPGHETKLQHGSYCSNIYGLRKQVPRLSHFARV